MRWLHLFQALPAARAQPHTFRKLLEERGELARRAAAWPFNFFRSDDEVKKVVKHIPRSAVAFAEVNGHLRLRLAN